MPRFDSPQPVTLPPIAPIPTPAPARLIRPNDGSSPTLTLEALMARQKELAAQGAQIGQMDMGTIPQGLAGMAQSFVNSLARRKAERDLASGQQTVAQAFGHAMSDTGVLDPAAMQQIMQLDPPTAMELMKTAAALRASQAKVEHWEPVLGPDGKPTGAQRNTTTGETKAAGDGSGTWKPSDIGSLRDDYTKAASTYDSANQSWQSMKEAAATALGSGDQAGKGAADYNMIIAFAKLLDPNSVVREGEVKSAAMTEGELGALQGWLNSWKKDGILSDDVRLGIMAQANSRMKGYFDQAKQKRDWITGIAGRHGVNPDDVVAPLGDFSAFEAPAAPAQPIDPPIGADGKMDPAQLKINQPYKFDDGIAIFKGVDAQGKPIWEAHPQ